MGRGARQVAIVAAVAAAALPLAAMAHGQALRQALIGVYVVLPCIVALLGMLIYLWVVRQRHSARQRAAIMGRFLAIAGASTLLFYLIAFFLFVPIGLIVAVSMSIGHARRLTRDY